MQMAGNTNYGAATALKQPTAMDDHNSKLQTLASRLTDCNSRLSMILDRVYGPIPQATAVAPKQDSAAPGVLHVAQFTTERIGLEIDDLIRQLSRLEELA